MNNNTFIYIIISFVFIVIITSAISLHKWDLTNSEKSDLDKKILIESNLPRITFDEDKLNNITTIKNIKF